MDDTALQGAAQLLAKLDELGRLDDGKAIQRAVRAGMQPALVAARDRIPVSKRPHKTYRGNTVNPGFAKKSLHIEVAASSDKQAAIALLGPRKEAFYATTFVEIGTSKMPPHPWLRPAFYSTIEGQKQRMVESLTAFLEKVASK